MEDFIMTVFKGLVTLPDEISIEKSESDGGAVLYNVSVAPDDMGRVIGKGGRMVKSIKALFKAVAAKRGIDATLEVR